MKIGVVGKGGVGKTTVAALVARAFASDGARVVCVETDSNPNLGVSLGLAASQAEAVPAMPRAAVVGAGGGVSPGELIEGYGRLTPSGVTLLSALRITEAGGGCTCGGHATVRSLLAETLDEHADVTVVDMEAGLEHLSRSGGTLAHANVLVIVMEPTRKSVITAVRTAALAEELGIRRVVGVGNKAARHDDAEFLRAAMTEHGISLPAVIPSSAAIADADRAGVALDRAPDDVATAITDLVTALRHYHDSPRG